jgi:LysR family glycine cleavage system transcriptional activator
MPRALPPLAWFRAFESAGRHLSFTAAALELGMTQSAISQHVRSLENRFGSALFLRKHRGLTLTDEGRRLMPSVSSAISMLQVATEGFETEVSGEVLTVATSVSIAQWFLVPRLRVFLDENPGTSVRISTKVWSDEFHGTETDVEIRFDSPESANPKAKHLWSRSMVIVAEPEFVEKQCSNEITPAEIASCPLIQVVGTNDTWEHWARSRGVSENFDIACYVDSHGMAVDFARSGCGVALTNLAIAASSLLDGSLTTLEKNLLPARDGYYMTVISNDKPDLSERFAEWLESEIFAICTKAERALETGSCN